MRGKIKKIHFIIEYPDGSEKEAEMKDLDSVQAIYFSESVMTSEMLEKFNISKDWKQNPTMIVQTEDGLFGNCNVSQCRINWGG